MSKIRQHTRIAAIHDISGFGRCSLTVVLPILSASGIETSVIPTAVLSTHTGGFKDFTYRDLTEDMKPFANHWKTVGVEFDALYTGFLGSFEQLNIVGDIFDMFRTEKNSILVDPVMADHGKLYPLFDLKFVKGMQALCSKADIIVPNITEACLLTDTSYKEGPYDRAYIEQLLEKLRPIGAEKIVLTGVSFQADLLGVATFDARTNETDYIFAPRIDGFYHGTGDIFASVLLSALLHKFSLLEAAQIAVNFTTESIKQTAIQQTDPRFGVHFEQTIPLLLKELRII